MSLTNRSGARQKRGRNYVCNGASSDRGTLKRRISDLHDIDGAITAWETRDSLNGVDGLEPLLDAFFSVVPREEDENAWKKFGFDLCNLALKIVKAVENTNDFQSHFCKLLPTVSVICSRCSGAWRLVLRPLLNIFTNKKMDFAHLKSSLKQLKTISKYAESGEMTKFSRENLHLLQGFFKLVLRSGDFLLQMDILEIVFIWVVGDRRLAEAVVSPANRTIRQLLETLNFLDFEKDSRIFLNAVNASLAACKRVFSINCNLVYFGNLSLSAPLDMDGIWVDVNRDSRRITIFCSDFNSNSDGGQRAMLQLSLSGIEKLKLEFGEVSGCECYCITVKIRSLPDMYEFAKGRTMVCAAPSSKNARDAVTDFARVVDELSAEAREKPQEGEKLRSEKTGYGDISKCQSEKRKPSCTSPVNITISSIDESEGKRKRKWNRMSRTSPLIILPKESKERMRPQPSKTVRDETNIKSSFLLQSIHLQVHQFSSSAIEMPSSSLPNNTDDLGERTVKLKSSELSNQSTPAVERQRLPQDMFYGREEAMHEKGQQGESPEEYRRRKDLTTVARICEDFILTDEFETEESVNLDTEAPKRDTRPTGGKRRVNREKAREKSCMSVKRKPPEAEDRRKTSLLDPNGYAYRRWLRPTKSERSNFWLNKLRNPHITVSKPETDVFQFTEEGDLTDDSNLFRKGTVAKERKLCPPSGRVRRRQEDQKTRAEITGRHTETRKTGSNSKTMVKPRGRATESKTEELPFDSRIRNKRAIARRDQVTDYCEPDTPTSNEKSKKGGKSGGGETVATVAARQKLCSTGKIGCSSAPREVQNKGATKTKSLKELDDIAKSLSSGFEKLMREVGEREAMHARKYAEEIDARMKALTEEEEEELSNRSTRFELCIQYFFQGCSALDSNGDLQAEMERRVETVASSNGIERYLQEKVSEFVGRLKEMAAEEAEATFHKHMKTARIHQFQQILSYNVSSGFHSRSQHFF